MYFRKIEPDEGAYFLSKDIFEEVLVFCPISSYCYFRGEFYSQIEGFPMGSRMVPKTGGGWNLRLMAGFYQRRHVQCFTIHGNLFSKVYVIRAAGQMASFCDFRGNDYSRENLRLIFNELLKYTKTIFWTFLSTFFALS